MVSLPSPPLPSLVEDKQGGRGRSDAGGETECAVIIQSEVSASQQGTICQGCRRCAAVAARNKKKERKEAKGAAGRQLSPSAYRLSLGVRGRGWE